MRKLKELTKKELIDLATKYSDYVQHYYEDHDLPNTPVCIEEFLNNEYLEEE